MKREWQSLPVSEGILDLVCSAVEMACCGGPSVIGSRVVGAVKSTIITFILLSGTHLRYNRS